MLEYKNITEIYILETINNFMRSKLVIIFLWEIIAKYTFFDMVFRILCKNGKEYLENKFMHFRMEFYRIKKKYHNKMMHISLCAERKKDWFDKILLK